MPASFIGGIHPEDNKRYTSSIPIHILDGDKEHVFPVRQHIGAPLLPIVEVGEQVKVGQKIADSDSYICAPVHASISGKVTAIEMRLHPMGDMVNSIIIQNDDKYDIHDSVQPKGDIKDLTPEQIINIVREAGVVGMGGAGFPTHVKLKPPADKKIDYVIINGSECEPYLTSDHRVMLESTDLLLFGVRAVMKVFGLDKGHIAIETNKPDAINILKAHVGTANDIKIHKLRTKYPQGSEKQLIYAVTRRKVPSGKLPSDVGTVVINVDTAVAIATAIKTGMPLLRRIVTVSGDAVASPANFAVRIGASFEYVLQKAGGFSMPPAKILMGGPMMGLAQSTTQVPVIKGTSAILAFSEAAALFGESHTCLKCGKCVKACPMGLSPVYLNLYAKKGDWDSCEKYGVLDCIECGACSYLCPGRQHPVQNLRVAKQMVMDRKRQKK